jgi:hypothetical protein
VASFFKRTRNMETQILLFRQFAHRRNADASFDTMGTVPPLAISHHRSLGSSTDGKTRSRVSSLPSSGVCKYWRAIEQDPAVY